MMPGAAAEEEGGQVTERRAGGRKKERTMLRRTDGLSVNFGPLPHSWLALSDEDIPGHVPPANKHVRTHSDVLR